MKKTSSNKILAFMLAFFVSALFAFTGLKAQSFYDALSERGNANLLLYGLFIVLFCVLFFVSYGILEFKRKTPEKAGSLAAYISVAACLLFTAGFLLIMLRDECGIFGSVADRYAWHKLPEFLVVLALLLLICFFLICVRNVQIKESRPAPWLIYLLLAALHMYTYYTPAIFKDGESNRLHVDAYYNSIYTALHGSPYSDNVNSVYGHYGILYRLPLKLLGGGFRAFVILNAFLLTLALVLMFLALHMMVKNNFLRIMGALAMSFPTLSMRGGYYWQLWPHRVVFMSIIIFYMAALVRFRKLNRLTMFFGYIICLLAIVWNTETGIFCALGFAAFRILAGLCEKKWTLVGVIASFAGHLALVLLSFFGAWGLVNVFNILHGGSVNSIKTFLFPLLSNDYMTDLLRIDLTTTPSSYMTHMLLLCIGLAWEISRMYIFSKDKEYTKENLYRAYFVFGVSVLTLGQISYYMNRAAYHNLDIGHLSAMLLMCMAAQSGLGMVKEGKLREWKSYTASQLYHGMLSMVNITIIFVLVLGMLIQYGYNVDYKTEYHDRAGIQAFAADIASKIPENTYAFGIGVSEIYAMLGWDTQIYTSDFGDASVNPSMTDYVIADMQEKKPAGVLLGEGSMRRLEKFASDGNAWFEENYELSRTFEFEGAVLEYYLPVEK